MLRRLLFSIVLFCLAGLMDEVNAQNLKLTDKAVVEKINNQSPVFMQWFLALQIQPINTYLLLIRLDFLQSQA